MNIRDLNDEHRERLKKACLEQFNERNKSRPDAPIVWYIYQMAFSDGVRATLNLYGTTNKDGSPSP
jgi:hypothetical protein